MTTNYGIISDVHQDPRIVSQAIEVLRRAGAEKLILNGDIGNQQRTLQDSQGYIAMILDAAGKSNLETYVQPGSHETVGAFAPVMNHFAEKYSNLIDATKNQKVENNEHSLVFLPGTDFSCGGEYQIGNEIESGVYQSGRGFMHYSNMNDLRELVTDPEKTVVMCHVPRKFDNVETGVDMAEFGLVEIDFDAWRVKYQEGNEGTVYTENTGREFQEEMRSKNVIAILGKNHICNGSVLPKPYADQILSENPNLDIALLKENRGNEDLRSLYEELGINKAVSSHFHESGHRAHDRAGNPVSERDLVSELFWNSGCLDAGQTGILTVNDGKISYHNIKL